MDISNFFGFYQPASLTESWPDSCSMVPNINVEQCNSSSEHLNTYSCAAARTQSITKMQNHSTTV